MYKKFNFPMFLFYLLDFLKNFQFFGVALGQVSVVGLVGQELGHFLVGSGPREIKIFFTKSI